MTLAWFAFWLVAWLVLGLLVGLIIGRAFKNGGAGCEAYDVLPGDFQ